MIRKLCAGKYIIPVEIIPVSNNSARVYLKFPFNKTLIEEVKNLEGAKWHGYDNPPIKLWSIPLSLRNSFTLNYLDPTCQSPYAIYETPLVDYLSERPLRSYQIEMVRHVLTRHYCVLACEMGTGKTLVAIEAVEKIKREAEEEFTIWYVGPKSGVKAVDRELNKWKAKFYPDMLTYEKLVREMKDWNIQRQPPRIVIFDECSKIKTPTSQRSVAALYLANLVREYWKDKGCIILMSGTPAPKSPVDWWHQAETACPGFLKEGNIHRFKSRLCIIEERESLAGGRFPHIVTWMDDESKCKVCGMLVDHNNHNLFLTPEAADFVGETVLTKAIRDRTKETGKPIIEEQLKIMAADLGLSQQLQYVNSSYHPFQRSVNEVQYLYKRMSGLVMVKFKKDCLDLPEKQYRIIKVKPTVEILRAANLIKTKSSRAITALTLLRELSDGFQYDMSQDGEEVCPTCFGAGHCKQMMPKAPVDVLAPLDIKADNFEEVDGSCEHCDGSGKVPKMIRIANALTVSPKDEHFIELLDDHEDIGRFVVWGGFTGTINRLVNICHQQGWDTLRVDGRGFIGTSATNQTLDADLLLDAMDYSHPNRQDLLDKYPKLCFVGHPEAGGMALTLTASPTALYYSNTFKGESRMQSEDRIHRLGMDTNRGATIIDLIHLPTDQLILDSLRQKRKLQNLSMGEMNDALKTLEGEVNRE
jgi:hypothetical protein